MKTQTPGGSLTVANKARQIHVSTCKQQKRQRRLKQKVSEIWTSEEKGLLIKFNTKPRLDTQKWKKNKQTKHNIVKTSEDFASFQFKPTLC